jgi:hypothetical protein
MLMSENVDVVIITGGHWMIAGMSRKACGHFIEDLKLAVACGEWLHWSTGAVLGSSVSGWYVRDCGVTPSERMAAAIEKAAGEANLGEDWKS